jgi:hypothetical protein
VCGETGTISLSRGVATVIRSAQDGDRDGTSPVSDSTICFVILAVTVVVFVWGYLPVAVVALGVALSLWATGVVDLNQALDGFGDPAVLFIASPFVVSEALDATG